MNREAALAASKFADLAKDFCSWCEAGPSSARAVESEAARWVARLHSEALALPSVGPDNSEGLPDIPEPDASRVQRTLTAFAGLYYREFFNPDPNVSEDAVIGEVQDDLLDIYKDIKGGLIVFQRGEPEGALWYWSFLHRVHWGRHTTSALYALHCKAAVNEVPHAP